MDLAKAVSMETLPNIPEEGEEGKDSLKQMTWCQKIKIVVTNITVEPIMICYILPNIMSSLAMQNLNLEKACRVDLALPQASCDAMALRNASGYTTEEEVAVQRLVATAMACKNILQSLLPAVLLIFLGSWSDRHNRRKPCILIPMVGEIITISSFILCTYYFYELGIIYNVLAEAIPPSITGGWFSMFMGIFSYISCLTSVETRTLRIGAVNLFSNVSVTLGIALSGILYRQIGFYGVYFLSLAAYIVGLTYGMIRMKEAPMECLPEGHNEFGEGKDAKKKGFISDFFDFAHVTDTFRVAFKDGERNRKARICTIMILVMVIIGPLHGEMNVMYLFVRYRFGWDEIDYSLYSTFNVVAHMIGTVFSLVFFSKYLQLDDSLLGMISSTSKVLSCLVYAFAPSPWIFYLGAVTEMLNGTSFIAMRSIISKLVPQDELGKIYSLFGVSEALMPLLYGPMYSMIYKMTIHLLPGTFFLAGGVLTLPAVFIFFWLYTEHKRDVRDEKRRKAEEENLLQGTLAMEKQNEKALNINYFDVPLKEREQENLSPRTNTTSDERESYGSDSLSDTSQNN